MRIEVEVGSALRPRRFVVTARSKDAKEIALMLKRTFEDYCAHEERRRVARGG
jgi:hypothetical protein